MPFDFAKTKTLARRTVHATLGVRAFYQDDSMNTAVEIKARWHNKIDRFGDLESQSYAEIIQGIDRVIFDAADARVLKVKRGGVVTFPDFGGGLGVSLGAELGGGGVGPAAFILQNREPNNGPVQEVWQVSRKESA